MNHSPDQPPEAIFSLAHLSALELTPPELVIAAADAGYKCVGLRMVAVTPGGPAWPLWRDRAAMAGTRARMSETGVGLLDVELVKLLPGVDVKSFEPCFEAAAELGARHVLTQADDPVFDRAVGNYAALCDLAAPYGLTCDIEFIPWLETNDLSAARRLISSSGRENCGLMIDTLHFARAGCDLKELLECPEEWFHYVQLCDAPSTAPETIDGLIYAAREERLFPGEGELDLIGILDHLPQSIVIGIEIPSETLSFTSGPEARARMARESALRLFRDKGYPGLGRRHAVRRQF
jgi:sugar phosphate isomerase/epimerase